MATIVSNGYQSGFGNEFASEAIEGVLPVGQNSPQRVAHGLYAEQLSGTEDVGAWNHSIDTGRACPFVPLDPAPRHDKKCRVTDEVVEVVKTTIRIVDRPLVQLRLHPMYPQLGLAHWCNGVPAHGRMAIDSKHLAIGTRRGKQITEQTMPSQIGLSAHDGNNFSCNRRSQYPDSFAYASNFR